MTLRTRIAVTAAAAVALAFLISAAWLYATTARTLRDEVDRSLSGIAAELTSGRPRRSLRSLGGARTGFLGGPGGFVQLVDSQGQVLGPRGGQPQLPRDAGVTAVAAGQRDPFFATVDVEGQRARVLTVPVVADLAAQVARPLGEIDASLAALRNTLALGGLAAIVLAAGLGTVVARGAVRPVQNLTTVAEQVAATGDLTRRIHTVGDSADELHRLARTFNSMLANLEQAREAQQQLVADASHELRTPLTSLRTNIEVLALDTESPGDGATTLSAGDRRRLLDDLTVQLDEFGRLVGALVELARGAQPVRTVTRVALDELVEAATDRARTFAPGQRFDIDAEALTVDAEADRLDRAVANLLDNAVKYGGGGPIDVRVSRSHNDTSPAMAQIAVRDHGPGIAPDDLPHVFDRFYRAPEVRDVRGSGLGLAIVQQVAEAHGGRTGAEPADGGGTMMTMHLPLAEPEG